MIAHRIARDRLWSVVLLAAPLASLLAHAQPSAPATPAAIVSRAIAASGGRQALTALRAITWQGTATINAGGRTVNIRGVWQALPPDTAVARTWLATQDSSASRTIVLAGDRGWLLRGTTVQPLPAALLAEERHQFYLYSLLRLVPLLNTGVTLLPTDADSAGNVGVVVRAPQRLDVTMYFGADGRVARLVTRFATADGSAGDVQELHTLGSLNVSGAHWFRDLRIRRNGAPYFDLHLDATARDSTPAAAWLPAEARAPRTT